MELSKKHFPGFSVVMATHSERIMKAFGLNIIENNLRKGAYIIETSDEEKRAKKVEENAIVQQNAADKKTEEEESPNGCS